MNVHKPVLRDHRTRGEAIHPLDHIDGHFLCDSLTIFTPTPDQIGLLMDRARQDLPVRLASDDIVQRVANANPDCFWAIARQPGAGGPKVPAGLVAMLMLNEDGVDALITGSMDTRDPSPRYLVRQNQRPAAIYGWLIHAKGRLAPGLTLVMEKLQAPLYRGADVFCRASTKDGAAFFDALGFSRGVWWDSSFYSEFRHYRRSHDGAGDNILDQRLRPPFDDYAPNLPTPGLPAVRTKVVRTLDEVMRTFAIRSAVYLEEQSCPYPEEFDGNDFSGTHLLALLDDEPVGCVRLRYFGDFAKLERLAVLSRFRHRGIGAKLVNATSELCRAKGYRRLYAHARKSLLPFWMGQGFVELNRVPFALSDYEYVEITKELEPSDSRLAIDAGPYVLIRPEGQWDRPGVLEQSAARGVKGARAL